MTDAEKQAILDKYHRWYLSKPEVRAQIALGVLSEMMGKQAYRFWQEILVDREPLAK
jgi:hypothetical protein